MAPEAALAEEHRPRRVELRQESDAAEKGLQRGDVIMSVNRQPVSSPAQVTAAVEKDEKLELDSTVTYALNLKTTTTTPKDRQSKSKYNTYRYKGLPPGPISAPGKAALEAAANPDKGKWLYFVTVNLETGETKFAETPEAHEKNVAEFQAWCHANSGSCGG